jgi:hypothetical protein
VIALSALLLMAGASDLAQVPAIRFDPCVQVDAEEVRRLTAIELGSWQTHAPFEALDVLVACNGGGHELRLTDNASGRVTVRSIDLGTPEAAEPGATAPEDRDARAREVALAIAELLRRVEVESAAPAAPLATAGAPAAAPVEPSTTNAGKPEPWRVELGVAGVGAYWSGGETLFGVDMTGRMHVTRWLIAELRLGGRKTRSVALANGSVDGHGVAAAAGLAFDATPGLHPVGVSFGPRLGVDWLRYSAPDSANVVFAGKDAAAVNLAAATTLFVMLSGSVCFTADLSAGTALHSIVVEADDRRLSAMSGVLLSGAFGLGGHF